MKNKTVNKNGRNVWADFCSLSLPPFKSLKCNNNNYWFSLFPFEFFFCFFSLLYVIDNLFFEFIFFFLFCLILFCFPRVATFFAILSVIFSQRQLCPNRLKNPSDTWFVAYNSFRSRSRSFFSWIWTAWSDLYCIASATFAARSASYLCCSTSTTELVASVRFAWRKKKWRKF